MPPRWRVNRIVYRAQLGHGSSVFTATGYRLDGPGIESRWGARFCAPVQTGPGAHPASCTMGAGYFLVVKSGRGVTLTPHPLLVPWSRKSTAIPLLTLRAVRPVQSLSACTRVHFTISCSEARLQRHISYLLSLFFMFYLDFKSGPKRCVVSLV